MPDHGEIRADLSSSEFVVYQQCKDGSLTIVPSSKLFEMSEELDGAMPLYTATEPPVEDDTDVDVDWPAYQGHGQSITSVDDYVEMRLFLHSLDKGGYEANQSSVEGYYPGYM